MLTETLRNGDIVKAGDQVAFIDSDGIERTGIIQYEDKPVPRLWFCNRGFSLQDYQSLQLIQNYPFDY